MRIFLHLFVILTCFIYWNKALLPIVEYAWNPTKMMELCENKDKPMMHCNGKCQRAQKIQMALGESAKNHYDLPQVLIEAFGDFIESAILQVLSGIAAIYIALQISRERFRPFLLFRPPIGMTI